MTKALLLATAVCFGVVACDGKTTTDGADNDTNDDAGTDTETDLGYDCDNLIPGPLDVVYVPGAIASSDVLFDDVGNLVGSDNSSIFKTPFEGEPVEFVSGLHFRAAMAYLPDGHIMYADNELGRLMRVDPEGQEHVVLDGLDDPNGLTVDLFGNVYASDEGAGTVLRVDPYTGEFSVLAENLTRANDLTFNRDYTKLYVDSFNDADKIIYTIDIDVETGEHGELTPWVIDLGSGLHDGLRVDACDNVYVCDYQCADVVGDTCVYRISPDGVVEDEPLIDPPGQALYIPNFEWGSDIGGWDGMTIFMPHGWTQKVYQTNIGVPAKPRVYP